MFDRDQLLSYMRRRKTEPYKYVVDAKHRNVYVLVKEDDGITDTVKVIHSNNIPEHEEDLRLFVIDNLANAETDHRFKNQEK